MAGAVEGAWAKANDDLYNLSEQELIDCGQGSCDGGWTSRAYDTIMRQGGIETETWYPYEGRDGSCRYYIALLDYGYYFPPCRPGSTLPTPLSRSPATATWPP